MLEQNITGTLCYAYSLLEFFRFFLSVMLKSLEKTASMEQPPAALRVYSIKLCVCTDLGNHLEQSQMILVLTVLLFFTTQLSEVSQSC